MSNHAYAQIDNQFVSIRPVRPRRPIQIVRRDYEAIFRNLRPSAPLTAQRASLDSLPTNRQRVVSNIQGVEVKKHQSQQRLISPQFFAAVLEASGPVNNKQAKRPGFKLLRLSKLQLMTVVLAVVLLVGGGYLSLVGWRSNLEVAKQAASLTKLANKATGTAAIAAGKSPALSTPPISAATLADYKVAPNLPRYIMIPKLGVDARVLSVGVTSTGALATPNNVYDTAWYNKSAEPGQPGAMLIDGHVSSWTTHGVFYGIKTLVAGDIIKIERGDGTIYSYTVVKTQVYPSGNVDMSAAVTPVVSGQPGLNLITCTGDVIAGTSTFNERVIVFATLNS